MNVTTYRLEEKPVYVLDESNAPLPGHYEVKLSTKDGDRVRRFLTDKGRAAVLRLMDEGRREISFTELREFTVEPDINALLARMEHESGEGA